MVKAHPPRDNPQREGDRRQLIGLAFWVRAQLAVSWTADPFEPSQSLRDIHHLGAFVRRTQHHHMAEFLQFSQNQISSRHDPTEGMNDKMQALITIGLQRLRDRIANQFCNYFAVGRKFQVLHTIALRL